jgi:hypothetical protein
VESSANAGDIDAVPSPAIDNAESTAPVSEAVPKERTQAVEHSHEADITASEGPVADETVEPLADLEPPIEIGERVVASEAGEQNLDVAGTDEGTIDAKPITDTLAATLDPDAPPPETATDGAGSEVPPVSDENASPTAPLVDAAEPLPADACATAVDSSERQLEAESASAVDQNPLAEPNGLPEESQDPVLPNPAEKEAEASLPIESLVDTLVDSVVASQPEPESAPPQGAAADTDSTPDGTELAGALESRAILLPDNASPDVEPALGEEPHRFAVTDGPAPAASRDATPGDADIATDQPADIAVDAAPADAPGDISPTNAAFGPAAPNPAGASPELSASAEAAAADHPSEIHTKLPPADGPSADASPVGSSLPLADLIIDVLKTDTA